MIDITMVTCNRARISEISITEIKERTVTPHRLIVMDNGSEDNTPEMLKRLHKEGYIDALVLWPENTGIHFARNMLLSLVETPWFVSTDDDIVPAMFDGEDWLARLEDLYMENDDYTAIACTPHVFIGAALPEDPPELWERSHVGAVLRWMHTNTTRRVGGWKNEKAPGRNNEEWWICGKLREQGEKVGYATRIPAIHLFGNENEDPWGYDKSMKPEDHGHREISPAVNNYSWERMGIDWHTCRPKNS